MINLALWIQRFWKCHQEASWCYCQHSIVNTPMCSTVIQNMWPRLHGGTRQCHTNITSGSCCRKAAPFNQARCKCIAKTANLEAGCWIQCTPSRSGGGWTWRFPLHLLQHLPQLNRKASRHPKPNEPGHPLFPVPLRQSPVCHTVLLPKGVRILIRWW